MPTTTPLPRVLALAGLLLAAAGPAPAQQAEPPAAPAGAEPSEPSAAAPEAPSEEPTLPQFADTVRVEVVNLEVFVTDRRGDPVMGLGADDFQLRVGGEEVPITNFYAEVLGMPRETVETGAPVAVPPREEAAGPPAPPEQRLYLVIAVDHAHLGPANRRRSFTALSRFVNENLRPEDAVTVVSLDQDLEVHADFLNDPATVDRILGQIADTAARSSVMEIERRQILSDLARGRSGGFLFEAAGLARDQNEVMARIRAYAANDYQRSVATLRLLDRLVASLAGVPGRKAVIYVGEGIANNPGEDLYATWINTYGGGNPEAEGGVDRFDFSTNFEEQVGRYDLMDPIEKMAERANAAGVTLYALDAENDHTSDLRSAQLEQGVSAEVLSLVNANLRDPLERAANATGGRRLQASNKLPEELARIAADFESFYSLGFAPPEGSAGENLRVEVRVEGPWRVRTRELLRAVGDEEGAAAATLASLLYNAGGNPLGVALAAGEPQRRDDGSTVLPLAIEIPFDRIGVQPHGDVVDARLSIFITVLDKTGAARPVQKLPFHLSIPADQLENLQGHPAHTTLPVVIRAGDRQVAVGVRDELSGVTSATRLELGRDGSAARP